MTAVSGISSDTRSALDHRVAVEQHDRRAPSLISAVVRDREQMWFAGRGRVTEKSLRSRAAGAPGPGSGGRPTPDTQYRIGSITKTFVATLVLRLRDEGRVDLSDPLDRHLPGTSFGDRTIGQLLSHSSGITAEPAGEWWERSPGREWTELAATTGPDTIRTRPGRRFHYTNLGYAALGELIGRVRGTDWFGAVQDEILRPLEMHRTTLQPAAPHATGWAVHPWADVVLPEPAHDSKGMAPAGQLWSTITDLGRWAAFIGGDTAGVLNPDTMAEMREPVVLDDESDWTEGYGLGLQLKHDRGRHLAGHTGSMPGFLATVWIDPADGTGAVSLTNTTAGPNIGGLTADLIDIMARMEPADPAEWTPMHDVDEDLLGLTGQWYWGPRGYGLRLRADKWLELAPLGGGDVNRFRPESDGTWTGIDGYYAAETLRVIRRLDGSVSHLDLNTFVLTRTPYDPAADVPGGVDSAGWRAGDYLG